MTDVLLLSFSCVLLVYGIGSLIPLLWHRKAHAICIDFEMSIHGIGVLVDESMWGIVPNLSMNAMDST